MNKGVFGELARKRVTRISDIVRSTRKSKYTVYRDIALLASLGIASKEKGVARFQENPASHALAKLLDEGFPYFPLLDEKGTRALQSLMEKKTAAELAGELGTSTAAAYARLKKLSPLLLREGKRYCVNPFWGDLLEFIDGVKRMKRLAEREVWSKGAESLVKVPLEASVEGSLTAFSRFPELGLEMGVTHNYFYKPKKSLSAEEVFVHALKCAADKNELALCALFYLKNQSKIDPVEVERLARRFDCLELWVDLQAYLQHEEVSAKHLFLPHEELAEKARVYGLKLPPKYLASALNNLLEGLAARLETETRIYLVGGGALLAEGMKTATKDVDVVVEHKRAFENVLSGLRSIGYREPALQVVSLGYRETKPSTILDKAGAPRVDLFTSRVCGIPFSKEMKERAKVFKRLGKLAVYVASPEDVFLLKCISHREGDLVDCANIMQRKAVDWKTVLDEYERQQARSKKFFGFDVLDHFEVLEHRTGISIPITKKVGELCLEKAIEAAARIPRTVKKIKSLIDFPEYVIRNKLNKLVRLGRVKKIEGKPIRFKLAKRA